MLRRNRCQFRRGFFAVTLMRRRQVELFCEDEGHEVVVGAILLRLAAAADVGVDVHAASVRGGHGKVLTELDQFVGEMRDGRRSQPDLFVAAIDANCHGYADKKAEIARILSEYSSIAVCAIPDPHVERWLLVDSGAFKTAVGRGCMAPDAKCEKERYKVLLAQAVRDAGRQPLVRGLEHAEAIVDAIDLGAAECADSSLGAFIGDLRAVFSRWAQEA